MIGPKKAATRAVPLALHPEQRHQDHDRDRQDVFAEAVRDELEALDRRKHRNRRRDDGVAGEQRRAGDAEQKHDWRATRRPSAVCASAISDRMPPSPRLSARIRNTTYLTVTVKISA